MSSLEVLANDVKYIREAIDEAKDERSEIKNLQNQTNGRVKDLERWRAFMMGGLAVITTILIPVAFKIIFP